MLRRLRFSFPIVAAASLLLAACHEGMEHGPLYEWEMVIPYSEAAANSYPIIGAVVRFDTLADCQKYRSDFIRYRTSSPWYPPTDSGSQELVRLLKHRTWCWPVPPRPGQFEESHPRKPGETEITPRGMLPTAENEQRLKAWRGTRKDQMMPVGVTSPPSTVRLWARCFGDAILHGG